MKNNSRIYALIAIGSILILSISCSKDDGKTSPALTTSDVSKVLQTTASGGGIVASDGNAVITEMGVCFGTTHYPTLANNKAISAGTTGEFVTELTGLTPNTLYYARAYATNSVGTGYGNEVSFTTLPYGSYSVTDIDGNIYHTVTIGSQVWLVENLKTTRFSDGSEIPIITDNITWSTQTTAAYCWYDNDTSNKPIYGALYNQFAVTDSRNLCPKEWHVPTYEEWINLENYLGGHDAAGGKLKATTLWDTPNTGADNSSGFTALPGAGRNNDGSLMTLNQGGYWWSASVFGTESAFAWSVGMVTWSGSVFNSGDNRRYGYSVRCIRDF